MRLRSKLSLAQLPLALALVVVGFISRRTMARIDHYSQNILKDNYQSVLAAQRMRDAADALSREPSPAQERLFEQQLAFQETNITEVGERELTEKLRHDWEQFRARRDLPSLVALEHATNDILAVNEDAMVRKSNRAQRDAEQMSSALLTASIAAFLLGILAPTIFTTRLVRPP